MVSVCEWSRFGRDSYTLSRLIIFTRGYARLSRAAITSPRFGSSSSLPGTTLLLFVRNVVVTAMSVRIMVYFKCQGVESQKKGHFLFCCSGRTCDKRSANDSRIPVFFPSTLRGHDCAWHVEATGDRHRCILSHLCRSQLLSVDVVSTLIGTPA